MKVVLDTNVLVAAISQKAAYHPIFHALVEGMVDWIVTQDILFEYLEIVEGKSGLNTAFFIESVLAELPELVTPKIHFNFNLISADQDDNKFVDAYIAGSADYLITGDKHFDILKTTAFPKVNVISPTEFLDLLKNETL